MIHALKLGVVRTCGFDIVHRGHCELLSKLILERTDCFVSYNTLRRLWGLAPGGEPQRKTLDALARFCGYQDYAQYHIASPKLMFWQRQVQLHAILVEPISQDLITFFHSQEVSLDSMHLMLDCFRSLILSGNWSTLFALLEADVYNPSRYPYAFQMHFAASLGHLLASSGIRPTTNVLLHPRFVEGVYLRLVDYSALNGYYGKWTDLLNEAPPNRECAIFLSCLNQLKCFLNDRPLPSWNLIEHRMESCPSPLAGRVFSVHVLRNPNDDISTLFNDTISLLNLATPVDFLFFHEPMMLAILTNRQNLLSWLSRNVKVDINRLEHFELHDLQTHRLMLAQNALWSGNTRKAQEWFSQVNPDEFLAPSCQDILTFPYHRVQAEIIGSENTLPSAVQKVVRKLGHDFFSERTWQAWFANVNESGS